MTLNAGAFVATLPLTPPALCPELRLHLATDFESMWRSLQDSGAPWAMTPPYWIYAWPAGQALARYLLDRPSQVAGKRVLDVGAGSGIAALAAASSGAKRVVACDRDPNAQIAVASNADANELDVAAVADLGDGSRFDLIFAADVWYERFASAALTTWLRAQASEGTTVLLSDTGRAYFPRYGLQPVWRSPPLWSSADRAFVSPRVYVVTP